MMKRKTLTLVLILLTALPLILLGQTALVVGEIVYFEGRIDIYRNGQLLDRQRVDFGFPVEQYDLIETKGDGLVEIALRGPVGSNSTVTLRPNTAFSLEHVETSTEKQSVYRVMRGSIGVQANQRAPNEGLRVRTATVAMGVRGTSFDVTVSVDGSILVAVSTGRVEVEDEQGRKANAQPGTVVEKITDKPLQSTAIAVEDLGLYQDFWVSSREEVFRAGAPTFIQAFARQYREYLPRFQSAYRQLIAQRSVLERYGRTDSPAPLGTILQAKTQVTPAIVAMRSILPLFEMNYFRLVDLEEFHSQGFGRTTIAPGLTSDTFFRTFRLEAQQINIMMANTRYFLKLYSLLHEASGGGPSLLDSPFGSNPFAPPSTPGSGTPGSNFPGSGAPTPTTPGSALPGSNLPGGTFRLPGN